MGRVKRNVVDKSWSLNNNRFYALILISIVTFLAYSNTFNVPFQFDDQTNIVKNQKITDYKTFGDISYWYNVNNRPFSFLTIAINYTIGELNTKSYHIFNFLVHVLNGFLVFLLANTLLKLNSRESTSLANNNYWIALAVSLVFVLHPIQTMGVTYIIQRMSSLATLFYILSIYLYIIGRSKSIENIKHSLFYLLLAGTSGLLAILSKQNAATLPIMILVVEVFFIRDKNNKPYTRYILSVAGLMAIGIIVIVATGLLPKENDDITRQDYLITQFKVLLIYLKLWLVPIGQNIDHGIIFSKSIGIREISGMLVYVGLITTTVLTYKKNKLISFGILWFLVTMLIESSLIPIQDAMVEHRLYLPSFGLSLVLVITIFSFFKNKKSKYLRPVLISILTILLLLTYARNKSWQTWKSIWQNSIELNPDNARAISNLGYSFKMQKNDREAMKYYNLALKKDSTHYPTYLNRGIVLFDNQNYKQAISDFSFYLNKYKDRGPPYFFRGVSYGHLGDYDKAINDLTIVINIDSTYAPAYKNRGVIYEMKGKYNSALHDFNRSLEIDPSNKVLLINRSKIYYRFGKYEEALIDVQDAQMHGISVDPNYISDLKRIILNKENNRGSINSTAIGN